MWHAGYFPTHTLTEDYALGMEMRRKGWRGMYVEDELVRGSAPDKVRAAFGQRSRWCKVHPLSAFTHTHCLPSHTLTVYLHTHSLSNFTYTRIHCLPSHTLTVSLHTHTHCLPSHILTVYLHTPTVYLYKVTVYLHCLPSLCTFTHTLSTFICSAAICALLQVLVWSVPLSPAD